MDAKEAELHYVYMINCNGIGKGWKSGAHYYYKIGVTNNLPGKIIGLQVSCPFELKLSFWVRFKDRVSANKAEREAHLQFFESSHVRGEWFQFFDHTLRGGSNDRKLIPLRRPKKFLVQQENVVEVSEHINGVSKPHQGNRHYIIKKIDRRYKKNKK